MKKLLILPIFCSLLLACDKVDHPLVNYVPPKIPTRKVLLEDYTGHKCGNCPRAAEVITTLHATYGEDLVVISIHAGDFAKTDTDFPQTFTTTAGNDWNMHFIGLAGAYPAGAVNRKKYAQDIMQYSTSKWSSVVAAGFKDEVIMDLSIVPAFDAGTRNLDVTVKGVFKKAYSKNVSVSVVLTEDSIVGPQTDYKYGTWPNYVFVHMLRDAVNGSWGTPFTSQPKAAKDSVTVTFSNFKVNEAFKAGKMSIVAFAMDTETKEVLEAERVKMTDKVSN
jgi:hypothetical protein